MTVVLLSDVEVTVDGIRRRVGVTVVDGATAVWAIKSVNSSRADGIQLSEQFPAGCDAHRIVATEGFEVYAPEHPQIAAIIDALRHVEQVTIRP